MRARIRLARARRRLEAAEFNLRLARDLYEKRSARRARSPHNDIMARLGIVALEAEALDARRALDGLGR